MRMSGWWLASFAASATRFASAMAALKPSSSTSRTIASPSRRQSPPASRSSISLSLSDAIAVVPYPLFVRIVSLVPHATELLFALGLGDDVVGVTHECDFPDEAQALPHITRDVLPSGLSSAEIDAAVRERT